MRLYRLYPPLFFVLALLGGLAVARAQAPNNLVGGAYNATPQTLTDKQQSALQLDADGSIYVNIRDYTVAGGTPTYGASVTAVAMALTATDVFCIQGSATKTVYIKQMQLTGVATTATTTDLLTIKRSTANTAGTPVAATAVPFDSNSVAATATVFGYSANPTLGTAVGTLHADKYTLTAATGAPANTIIPYNYNIDNTTQNLVLRGVAQEACFNMNGITPGGAVFSADIIWMEQ
jgi:hypothetical protein